MKYKVGNLSFSFQIHRAWLVIPSKLHSPISGTWKLISTVQTLFKNTFFWAISFGVLWVTCVSKGQNWLGTSSLPLNCAECSVGIAQSRFSLFPYLLWSACVYAWASLCFPVWKDEHTGPDLTSGGFLLCSPLYLRQGPWWHCWLLYQAVLSRFSVSAFLVLRLQADCCTYLVFIWVLKTQLQFFHLVSWVIFLVFFLIFKKLHLSICPSILYLSFLRNCGHKRTTPSTMQFLGIKLSSAGLEAGTFTRWATSSTPWPCLTGSLGALYVHGKMTIRSQSVS